MERGRGFGPGRRQDADLLDGGECGKGKGDVGAAERTHFGSLHILHPHPTPRDVEMHLGTRFTQA